MNTEADSVPSHNSRRSGRRTATWARRSREGALSRKMTQQRAKVSGDGGGGGGAAGDGGGRGLGRPVRRAPTPYSPPEGVAGRGSEEAKPVQRSSCGREERTPTEAR